MKRIVERLIQRRRINPWEFWRTIPDRVLDDWTTRGEPAPLEDIGRSAFLSVGFLLVGGVSPYLGLWLGLLLSLPLFLWTAIELRAAGWPLTGPVLILLSAASPFVVESLTLPHSAVAFYLLTLLALVAFAVWATADHPPSPRALWIRLAATSLIFTAGTIARAGSLLFLPGFAIVLYWARRRHIATARAERLARSLAGTTVLVVVFLLPYAALRPPQYHNVWVSLWEGMGDFGSDRGYSWYDTDAQRFVEEAGLEPFDDPKHVSPEHERLFRQRLLRDIASHPLWYAGVLAKRVAATAGLTHLLPYFPRDGQALGVPRFHYKYTTPADWIGLAGHPIEMRVEAMWLAPLAILGIWLERRRRGSRTEDVGHSARALKVVALVFGACLALPVIVSTAAGIETQAIIFGYYLSAGFVLDQAWVSADRFRARTSAPDMSTETPSTSRDK